MAYNKISTLNSKVKETGIALTLRAGTTDYPLIYSDNVWQVATSGSALYNALGDTGSYTQETINNFLLEHIAAGTVSLEIVEDHTTVASPSATTLYLEKGTDSTLFTTYIYQNSAWVSGGSITLNLDKYTYADSNLTNGNVVYANGDKSLVSTNISKTDLEAFVTDFKGLEQATLPAEPADGTIAKLLQEYREGNGLGSDYTLPTAGAETLGGIKTGFTKDDTNKNYPISVDANGNAFVNVPWEGDTTEASDTTSGLMTPNQYLQLQAYKTEITCKNESDFIGSVHTALDKIASGGVKSFCAPLLISTTNCFGISTTSDYRVQASFAKTGSSTTTFVCKFEAGNYKYEVQYNGSSLTLFHIDYVVGDAEDVSFSI